MPGCRVEALQQFFRSNSPNQRGSQVFRRNLEEIRNFSWNFRRKMIRAKKSWEGYSRSQIARSYEISSIKINTGGTTTKTGASKEAVHSKKPFHLCSNGNIRLKYKVSTNYLHPTFSRNLKGSNHNQPMGTFFESKELEVISPLSLRELEVLEREQLVHPPKKRFHWRDHQSVHLKVAIGERWVIFFWLSLKE